MPTASRRNEQWSDEGLALYGQVLRYARETIRGLSLDKFVWDIWEYWGYEVATRDAIFAAETVRRKHLNLELVAFAQPLTYWPAKLRPFTLRELLDVAAGKIQPDLPVLPVSIADIIQRWLCIYRCTESEQLDLVKRSELPDLRRWRDLRDGYARPTQAECKALAGLIWLPGLHRYTATDLWLLAERQNWAGNQDDRPPYLSLPIAATEGGIYRTDDSLTGTP